MNDKITLKQIGDEMVRVLEPVYADLDEIKKIQKEQSKTLNEHTNKIDALTGDMVQVQAEQRVAKDVNVAIKEKLQGLSNVVGDIKVDIEEVKDKLEDFEAGKKIVSSIKLRRSIPE